MVGFAGDPKAMLEPTKDTVPLGKGLVRTLVASYAVTCRYVTVITAFSMAKVK